MSYQHTEIKTFLKLGYTVSIISIILIVWLFFAKVDVVAQTQGKVIPEGKLQTVSVLETSRIEKVLVKEGEKVSKNQIVAVLDKVANDVELKKVKEDYALNQLRVQAINSILFNQPFVMIEENDKFYQIKSEFEAKKITQESNLLSIQAEILQAESEISSTKANIKKLESSSGSWSRQIASYTKLREVGFASKMMADEKIREAQERLADIKVQKEVLLINEAKLKQVQSKYSLSQNDYKQQLFKEKTELIQKQEMLGQEKIRLEHSLKIRDLISPIDGYIHEITTNSPGAVLNEGNMLMSIVPIDDVLKAEVLLKNNDIGYIDIGQKVKLKIETFPFQKYGLLEGVIEKISPDSIEDKETRQNLYKVIVKTQKNYLERDNKKYYIKPGMVVNADILTSKRSIFEYLTSPIQKTILESAHER